MGALSNLDPHSMACTLQEAAHELISVTSFLGLNDSIAARHLDHLPEDPPEQPEPVPAPEVHLPSDGPIGDGYRLIPDVPLSRVDDFNGPAMQPYDVEPPGPSAPTMSAIPISPMSPMSLWLCEASQLCLWARRGRCHFARTFL
ncbi:unnamed protein product [Cladocopium goreaui]|uniref:DEAD-box ATP-dependent RNA helicase 7 n=1 Tax=Cladocopium goreaui TaxID=2562237 RepID=A0A9P1CDG5_9DINO|nr:unnamed protein product [Cladocopium goreaui]